jgi:hypothetical protein
VADRPPLERRWVPGGCPQHALVQRQRDLAIGEHDSGVTRGCQCAKVMEGGNERQAASDHVSQGLVQIEDRDEIEPVARFVENHERVTACIYYGNGDPP